MSAASRQGLVAAKMRAIPCHATQISAENHSPDAVEQVLGDEWFGFEHFVLARSEVRWPQGKEGDLFQGLR